MPARLPDSIKSLVIQQWLEGKPRNDIAADNIGWTSIEGNSLTFTAMKGVDIQISIRVANRCEWRLYPFCAILPNSFT